MNTEAARLGIIKRKLVLPEASYFSTVTELAHMINLQFQVLSKLFKMVLQFGKRYLNDSYSVTLFINMNRLVAAEVELNELVKDSKELLVMINFLRLKNVALTLMVKTVWLKQSRDQLKLMQKNNKKKEEDMKAMGLSQV